MPAHTARRGNRQHRPERRQREIPVFARGLDDHDPFANPKGRNAFVRIVIAVLNIGRAAHHGAGGVQHIDVVIIGRGADGIGPEQVHPAKATRQNGVVGRAAKVVQAAASRQRGGAAILEIALPCAGSILGFAAAIAGGRKEQRARGGDVVHSSGDRAVLERRLHKVKHIIHDDAAARRLKVPDVLRETGDALTRRRKVQRRPRRQIVDDLQHRGAFAVAGPALAGQHRNGRQLPGGLGLSEVGHAVRQHANLDPGTVGPIPATHLGGPVSDVASRSHRADVGRRPVSRAQRTDLRPRGESLDPVQWNLGANGVVLFEAVHDLASVPFNELQQFWCDLRPEVHQHTAVSFNLQVHLQRGQPRCD